MQVRDIFLLWHRPQAVRCDMFLQSWLYPSCEPIASRDMWYAHFEDDIDLCCAPPATSEVWFSGCILTRPCPFFSCEPGASHEMWRWLYTPIAKVILIFLARRPQAGKYDFVARPFSIRFKFLLGTGRKPWNVTLTVHAQFARGAKWKCKPNGTEM